MKDSQTINGRKYIAIQETANSSCCGCAFDDGTNLCEKYSKNCFLEKYIWVKSTETENGGTSIEEVLKAVSIVFELPDILTAYSRERIDKQLAQMYKEEDPDYQKYLELKNKFEG